MAAELGERRDGLDFLGLYRQWTVNVTKVSMRSGYRIDSVGFTCIKRMPPEHSGADFGHFLLEYATERHF